ncbi:MAG: UDP-N-acetylmuramoyl-L-alanine--D-glutamate ligase [Acidobacteria bacterium]|nr:UDP-N-acetylmuramoyl-L-alanine--D-glutamate ligase [Acidobacteriota bacterium]
MGVTGKRVLVVGFARSGQAVARCLSRRGALVTVSDSRPPWAFEAEIRELMAHKIGLELGQHREETFLGQDLIVLSPGVFPEPPALQAARQQGIPIIPEVEAAGWFLESRLAGITGTNGKTTTTALLGKVLAASGFETFVGGNIGVPLIAAVDQVSPDALVVAELSSFQLETIRDFRPDVAVLLNLQPNHLDRHPSFEAYVQAKAQIFRNQTEDDLAILNADDPTVMSLAPEIRSRKVFFSRKQNLPDGVFVSNGSIRYRVGNLERVLLETREVPLRGQFNIENVLAAAATACALGADFEALRRAVREFKAVEHRLEFVREVRGVEFFNDSKATSVDAAANALSAFDRGVHLILGGKDKGAPYAPLRRMLEGRVRYLYLIGAAAERIARQLAGAAEMIRAGELETALREAFRLAEPGDVVLLSPACASFDQFKDYEHRGRVFKELVEKLAQEAAVQRVESSEPVVKESNPFGSFELVSPGVETAGTIPSTPPPTAEPVAPEELIAEARATTPEDAEPAAPTMEPRELLYVYEVAAEEGNYPDSGQVVQEDGFEPFVLDEMLPPEELDDEALPFETRGTPARDRDGAEDGSQEPAAEEARERNRFPGI